MIRTLHTTKAKKEDKGWGYELHIVNNGMYCGKILHYNAGGEMSMHYHIDKFETWYVLSGEFYVSGINPDTAEEYYFIAKEGDVIDITRGMIHSVRCESKNGGEIMEVSTPDSKEDNYRVYKGDSQKQC